MPTVDPSVNYRVRSIHFLLNPVSLDKDTTPEDFLDGVLQGLVSCLLLLSASFILELVKVLDILAPSLPISTLNCFLPKG